MKKLKAMTLHMAGFTAAIAISSAVVCDAPCADGAVAGCDMLDPFEAAPREAPKD